MIDDSEATPPFEVHVLVTDLQIEKTVRVTGNMGIGQLILKVVEMIDMNIDWSDQAIWWPEPRKKWLLRPRGTLDQYGVSHDTKLWLTRMHRAVRVQLPDLRVVTDRVDFSRNVFNEVLGFCKRLGIRHAEELSFARKSRSGARRRSGDFSADGEKEQVPPADVGLTRSPYMPTTDFGAPQAETPNSDYAGGLGYLATPSRDTITVDNRSSVMTRQSTLRRDGTLTSPGLRNSFGSLPDGTEGPNLAVSDPISALEVLPTMPKARTIREKARLNSKWLDSSLSLMEQDVREGELIYLRFKYFAVFDLDRGLDASRINQLFEQAKWSILNEEIECSENEMWMFAALQLQARLRSAVVPADGQLQSPTLAFSDDPAPTSVFNTLVRSQPSLLDDTQTRSSAWASRENLGGGMHAPSSANLTMPGGGSSGAHSISGGDDADYTELDPSQTFGNSQHWLSQTGGLLSSDQLRALEDEIEADLDSLERQLELGQLEPVIQASRSQLGAGTGTLRLRASRDNVVDSQDGATSQSPTAVTPMTPITPLTAVKTRVPELNDFLGYFRAKRTLGTLRSFKRVWFTFIDTCLSAYKQQTAATPQSRPDAAWNLRGAEVHSECNLESERYVIKLRVTPMLSALNGNGKAADGAFDGDADSKKPDDAKPEEIWLKCENKEQYAKWLAAFRMASRAKTMASAAYECEVHTILAFLNLQKASVSGSRQTSTMSLSQAINISGTLQRPQSGATMQRRDGALTLRSTISGTLQSGATMQRQPSSGTLISSPGGKAMSNSVAALASNCVPEDFVAARFFKRYRPRQIVKRILNAHANVREMSALEAKLNYISAFQRLADYGVSYFEARFSGSSLRNNTMVRRDHLLAVAPNRFMMVDAQTGATLKSWPFSMMKTWTTNYESRTVEFLIVPSGGGRDETVLCTLESGCDPRTVHEFIGGYLFLATRSMDRNQQLDEELFHKMTGRHV